MTRYYTDDDSRALDALADEEPEWTCPECNGQGANCPTCCEGPGDDE